MSFCQPSSVMVILLPSLSCRSLYSPCVGSASFNHVDHPRSDLYCRHQPARREFRISALCHCVCLLLARSRPVAGLVVCGYPVPPSRSGQYRGYGPACLTFVGANLRSPLGTGAASGGFVNVMCLSGSAPWSLWSPRHPHFSQRAFSGSPPSLSGLPGKLVSQGLHWSFCLPGSPGSL